MFDDRGIPERLEDEFGTGGQNRLDGSVVIRPHRMSGADRPGQVELRSMHVDRHDRVRAGERRPITTASPTPPHPRTTTEAPAGTPAVCRTAPTPVVTPQRQLVCRFKEAGLGNTLTVADISCSADATAVYQCFNNGGNHPKAGNKETVGGPVSNDGTFPVRNGQTTGSITVSHRGPVTSPGPTGRRCSCSRSATPTSC